MNIYAQWCSDCCHRDVILMCKFDTVRSLRFCCEWRSFFNLSPPSAGYMRQWIGSALVQIMACRLFGAKPWSKLILVYCQLDAKEQTSVKFQSKYKTFHSRKCSWKYLLWNGGLVVLGEMSWCLVPQWNIDVSENWVIIGLDNGLSPIRHQAFVQTNNDSSLARSRKTIHTRAFPKIYMFPVGKINLKISSVGSLPS